MSELEYISTRDDIEPAYGPIVRHDDVLPTQDEVERMYRLMVDVLNGRASLVTIMPSVKGGRLFVKKYRNAA